MAAMAQPWYHVLPGHPLGAAQLQGMPYTILFSLDAVPLAIVFDKSVTAAHMIARWCANDTSVVATVALGMWAHKLGADIIRHPDVLVAYLQKVRTDPSLEPCEHTRASIKAQKKLAREWVTNVALAFQAGALCLFLCQSKRPSLASRAEAWPGPAGAFARQDWNEIARPPAIGRPPRRHMCHLDICCIMSCWFPYCQIACKASPGLADQWLPDDDNGFRHDGDGAGLSECHGQADTPQQH